MGAVDEQFLGHAAADHAGAADPIFLGDGDAGAVRGRDPRRAHAARAGADDEQVIVVGLGHAMIVSEGAARAARRSRGRNRAARSPSSAFAISLPSSTPNWSNGLMPSKDGIGEGAMLVKGEQRAERRRIEPVEQDRRRRPVAGIVAVRIVGCAAGHQRRPLREAVEQELAVMLGVERVAGLDAATNSTGTRCVPWWRSWNTACWASVPTPPQTIGAVARPTGAPSSAHALAVRFHFELLEIGGKQPQPLVISEDRAGLGAADIGVRAIDEGGEDRRVGARAARSGNGGPSPPRLRAALERVPAQRQRGREADRGPERDSGRRRFRRKGRMRVSSTPNSIALSGSAVSAITRP